MNICRSFFIIGAIMTIALGLDLACQRQKAAKINLKDIKTISDVSSLFPTTSHELDTRVEAALQRAREDIARLIAIKPEERTFANTAQALDSIAALSDFAIMSSLSTIIEMVYPDEAMRTAAHNAVQKLDEFMVDNLANNVAVYNALKEYVEGNAQQEDLTLEQQYYLTEAIRDFERNGLNLPEDVRTKVATLQKELAKLAQDFEVNIANDNRTITVDHAGLQGLDEDFIAALKKTDDGKYILGVDYPTYHNVMENAAVEDTRKRLYVAFSNRGYPANDAILKTVIQKRDELANLLRFRSFAALNLDNAMAETPENALAFLDGLLNKTEQKVKQEVADFTAQLPEGITLTKDGKIKAWDMSYIKAHYKKKHFNIDERAIAEYFPMEYTVAQLLDIYHQFLSVNFKVVPVTGLWHPDVQLVKVSDTSGVLGYLLLDLYPRPNKYSHACHAGIIPAVFGPDGQKPVKLSLVIANFQKPTATKPSLLRKDEVKTFFHEFGHAMHSILGRTHLASQAGTAVKMDFVEMPSQMLEEWMYDAAILKKISKHYINGSPLPDELIGNIQAMKNYDSGDFVQRQVFLSKFALALYASGAHKDPYTLMNELTNVIRKHVHYDPQDHFHASFGHLMGYGAKYYGYLWSKVYALDLFDHIRKHGLLNADIGHKYVQEVIGRGGSKDPNILLYNFLGREPNADAFFADLGL